MNKLQQEPSYLPDLKTSEQQLQNYYEVNQGLEFHRKIIEEKYHMELRTKQIEEEVQRKKLDEAYSNNFKGYGVQEFHFDKENVNHSNFNEISQYQYKTLEEIERENGREMLTNTLAERENNNFREYYNGLNTETIPQSESKNQITTSTLTTDYNSREEDKSFNITTIFTGILAFIIFSTLFYIIYKMIKYHFTKDTPRYVIIFISIIIIGLLMLFASIINIPDTDPYQYQRMSRQ